MSPWSALLLLVASLPLMAAPLELFVAPDGRDSNSGRTAAQSLATLQRARDLLRAARAAGQLPAGAVVRVAAGSYPLTETLALGPEDAGTAAAPVVWRGEPGEGKLPVIVGGPLLNGWQPERGAVYRLDLKAQGLGGLSFNQLFYQGQRMTLARTPNLDPQDIHGGVWAHVLEPASKGSRDRFAVTAKELDPGRWSRPSDGVVHIFPNFDWAFNRLPIKAVDGENKVITLGRGTSYDLTTGDRFFVEGLIEELDAPGEWYLDKQASVVYFQPPGELADGQVSIPRVGSLVTLTGAHHVRFEGFVFEGCDGDGVQLRDCEGAAVTRSIIRNTGAWGVNVSGGRDCRVAGCEITATGSGGVLLNGGDRRSLTPAGHQADNNYIHHVAAFNRTYNCAVSLGGVGNAATHNLIHDTPHAAVTVAGNDNLFEYNIVHHTNLQSTDTGGLYSCPRDWTQRGNIIRYNLWHDLGGFGKKSSWQPVQNGKVGFEYPHFTWGIYMDDPTSGNLIYGNILYRVPICGLHNHGGRDNVWENNVIVDCPAFQAGMLSPDWGEWPAIYQKFRDIVPAGSIYFERYPALRGYRDVHPEEMSGLKFVRNIVYYTTAGTAWLRGVRNWGNVQQLYGYTLREEDFSKNEFDYNLISCPPELELQINLTRRPQPNARLTWPQWQATGMDTHSQLADPKFVDPANHNYALQPDSPALALGFKPIPIERIGLYESAERVAWPVVEAPGASGKAAPLERHFQLPGFEPLPAEAVTLRRGLGNTAAKLRAGQAVTVAYFGGGIHDAGGWRAAVGRWLKESYPQAKITLLDGSITDAVRGSGFSVYRFRHDVLEKRPDLVMIDFTSDDHQTPSLDIQRQYEGIFRQARRANPQLDLVLLHAFRAGMESAYRERLTPPAVTAIERVAAAYGVPSINMGLFAADLFAKGGWNGHTPNPALNELYASAVTDGLQTLLAAAPAGEHPLPKPLREDNLEAAGLLPITPAMLSGEWSELPPTHPDRQAQARHFETLWFTNQPGAKLTFTFTGSDASLYWLIGPDTGRIRVTVDGKDQGIKQQVDPWCYYQRLASIGLASGLPPGPHTVVVELLPEPPDRALPIAEARKGNRYDPKAFEGVALRLGWIRTIGAP